ncbi:type VI secretion system-associated FHA domain protein TagH [Actibacterium pelagium]|uniref:Phosphopeptide-binding protein n=1 Tax=Actibacterium pelagium TaxID=2029103 RepID=A0A917AJK9_9RHOB|nr:type VI secretion system-associated FHA domain protein TagH [Actibacterium pelagium]GGE53898.1 phosphopeptide-binding protein [Actibacterium pelagium]
MPVTLKFQSTGLVPGDARPLKMRGGSLTVGRGPTNDLVLPDPDRTLSKNHFVIEDHNGNVMIVDLSTNGTFLNYSKIPLGKTPTPLNNGDILSVGGYEMVVEILDELADVGGQMLDPLGQDMVSPGVAQNAPDPMSLLDDSGPEGDFLDDLLGAPEGPKGPSQLDYTDPINELLPPVGEEEDPFFQKPADGNDGQGASAPHHNPSVTDSFASGGASSNMIPDDWDDLLAPDTPEDPPAPPPATPAPPVAAPTPEPPVAPAPPAEPLAESEKTEVTPALMSGDQSAARAFLKSVSDDEIAISDDDLQTTMARMGRVMKAMITGLREILMTRTSIKSEFRIEQTMISAGGNNPLKFSISPEQAIEALVKPATKGYLGAETATEQALNDIKAHEVAMVTGMEAALKGVLSKLDPAALEEKLESGGGLGGLLKGKKARYWEVYEKMYAEISDQAENDFHELFSREFARAYKEQLDKLK